MGTLLGKRALVTGASRGIGKAIALALASEGADVVVTYEHSRDKAEAVVAQIQAYGRIAFALQADSGDATAVKDSVDKAAHALGGLDILVNNAGIFQFGTLDTLDLEQLDALISVNIKSAIIASHAALAHLPEGGRIINLGSCLADRVPSAGLSLYSMTKAALIAFTKGLARDLGPRGITVNIVHPGPTDTDMNPANPDKLAGIALGRYGTSEDVAAMVAFLAGPGARQITGSGFAVDGGSNA